ncbi:MAG TPA: phosphodiesterase [Acetobacteraceae bacterium]|nr:phosphodiesterase [Acetobacteraceae bacterium]
MFLVQLTDLHIRPEGKAGYRVAETNMLSERALRAVRALRFKPDAIVISGDLTDNGLDAEHAVLNGMLRREISGTPIYVIPGNHDRREAMRSAMAAFPGVTSDPEFVQYSVEDLPVRLVMLDTVVPGHGHGELCAKRLAWLDRTLAAAPERTTIVVMHHPPFVTGIGHMDAINLRDSDAFAAVIARHRQVERILCGHHHRPIIGRVAHAIASVAPSVAHQVELDLHGGEQGFLVLEPPAFHIHALQAGRLVTHTMYVEQYPGPFPFVVEPEYPGAKP